MTDPMELKLTGIAFGGEAMGKIEGRVVFVAYALPGETVRIEIVEERQRWMRGRLLEVLEPSPYRIEPSCPHFGPGRCGGCQWQHIDRQAQLDYKRRLVQDQLQRVGGVNKGLVRPTLNPGPDWAYRTQILFYPHESGTLGLRQLNSYEVHAIDHCPILHPRLADLYEDFNVSWDGLRSVDLALGVASDQRLVTLHTRHDEVPELEVDIPVSIALEKENGQILPLIGSPWYFEIIGGQQYRFSAGTQRPINPAASETLLALVADYLKIGPGKVLMDVYCGGGLFTLGLAERSSLVIGVDDDPIAIEDCAFNCSHLDNVALHEGPPPKVLKKLDQPIDVAIVSPPQEGIGRRMAQNLARMGASRLVYVCQHPLTLARDLAVIQKAGFRLEEVTPIDVAPHTFYVTTVGLLTR